MVGLLEFGRRGPLAAYENDRRSPVRPVAISTSGIDPTTADRDRRCAERKRGRFYNERPADPCVPSIATQRDSDASPPNTALNTWCGTIDE
jgi:hypothetical protein